ADHVPPVAGLWMGPKAHFVHYYVSNQRMVNCAAVVEQESWQAESWTQRGNKQDLLSDFSGWHPMLQQLLQAADESQCYRWGLFDREPARQWHSGRVALLGDACHPSLPFLAQGAAMAIEDAAVLAQCLKASRNIEAALATYAEQRRSRVARVQALSRRNGRIYHLSGLPAFARNCALRLGLVQPLKTMDWLYSR
ncbi:MAG: FAD-dependent monooxygenase, partial [Nevskiales bacterium]